MRGGLKAAPHRGVRANERTSRRFPHGFDNRPPRAPPTPQLIPVTSLPHLNALLNSASAILLLTGYYFIRQRNIAAHRRCMLAALGSSGLFLISYLIYHFSVGSVRFQGTGWIRPVYFAVLVSHTVLATAIVPLVLLTVVRAWRERFDKHRAIARWTLPLWLYVSATGVAVYWMLYQMSY